MAMADLVNLHEAAPLLANTLMVRESIAQALVDEAVQEERLHPVRISGRVRYRRAEVLAIADRVIELAEQPAGGAR
jgi:hypothetical protein